MGNASRTFLLTMGLGLWVQVGLAAPVGVFASLPGSCTRFVDQYAPVAGTVHYAVRGRMGASKSLRTACDVMIVDPRNPRLSRGAVNGDGRLNITDAIVALGYLFTGGRTPACLKAADADDSGAVNITDPIYALNFLFLGGRAPKPPFPGCGEDPTADALACETQPGR